MIFSTTTFSSESCPCLESHLSLQLQRSSSITVSVISLLTCRAAWSISLLYSTTHEVYAGTLWVRVKLPYS